MMDVPTIQLGVDEQKIDIILHHRPFPMASHAWDRDAIAATVEVTTGAFRGQLSTIIFSHELELLRRLLSYLNMQVGHVEQKSFELREGVLSLTFELTKLGHIDIRVKASDMKVPPATLTFTIQSDQTYLPKWIDEVSRSLAHFPKEI